MTAFSESQDRLAAIVPAYNEAATVAEMLSRLIQQPVVQEIVLVDDGSTDATLDAVRSFVQMHAAEVRSPSRTVARVRWGSDHAALLRLRRDTDPVECTAVRRDSGPVAAADGIGVPSYAEQVRDSSLPLLCEAAETASVTTLTGGQRFVLIQHDKNRGKGRAIRTGLEYGTSSHVIIQDADLEYDPADIAKLWAVMQSGEADVVYGSRYLDNPKLQKGRFVMQSGVRFLNLLVRVLYGVKLTDEATCYKMFRAADLRRMELQCEKFEFCPEVTARAIRLGLTIKETKTTFAARHAYNGKKLRWRDGVTAFCCLLCHRFGGGVSCRP